MVRNSSLFSFALLGLCSAAMARDALNPMSASFLTAPPASGRPIPATERVMLVENGQPRAVIVLPDSSRDPKDQMREIMVTQSGIILSDAITRMTGAKLPVVRQSALGKIELREGRLFTQNQPSPYYVLVGESEWTRQLGALPGQEPGALCVKASGNVLAFTGNTDGALYSGGVLSGVRHFLESNGVRYLWPGELGLVVPQRATLSSAHGSVAYAPVIRQRSMRMVLGSNRALEGARHLGLEGDYQAKLLSAGKLDVPFVTRSLGGWMEWQNLGGNAGISGGHAFGKLWEKYGKDHPGWFALQPNGTRNQTSSDRAQLCLSNSELIDHIASEINARAEAEPNLQSLPIGLNDGGNEAFCMCQVNALGEPGCTTYDPPNGRKIKLWGYDRDYVSLTDRVMTFSNRVAENVAAKHPNLLMVVDAYSLYQAPPVNVKLHPNLVVRYVPSTMDDWDAWSSKASKIFWRPNTLSGPWRVGELKFNSAYANDLRYAATHSTVATDFDSILNNWATEGLNYYVLAKLNFNPDLDVNALVDDYCAAGFGPAAKPIRTYFDRVDKLTDRREKEMFRRYFADPPQVILHVRPDTLIEYYTPQFMGELRQLLSQAEKAVPADAANPENGKILRRIAFLRIGLDWTDLQARAFRAALALKQEKPVDLQAAAALLEERRAFMRKVFEEEPLAVNVAYINFADRSYWQGLQEAIAKRKPLDISTTTKPGGGQTVVDADEEGRPILVPKH